MHLRYRQRSIKIRRMASAAAAHETKPGLVDKRWRLERLTRGNLYHPSGCQSSQLIISKASGSTNQSTPLGRFALISPRTLQSPARGAGLHDALNPGFVEMELQSVILQPRLESGRGERQSTRISSFDKFEFQSILQ